MPLSTSPPFSENHRVRAAGSVLACVTLLATTAFAQESGWVVPDAGTGIIRGHVVSAVDRRPLARALVTLSSPTDSWRHMVADEHGWFEFTGLPARRYELRAKLAGYLTLAYGQTQPTDPPKSISVKNGQVRSGLDIALPAGGVIAVRVMDETGVPVEGAFVQAQRPQVRADGALTLALTMGDKQRNFGTDDRGVIRIYDLEPGDYYVSATPPVVLGQPNGPDDRERTGRLQTFHPGVVRLAEAEPVTLGLGEEIGIDLVIAKPFTAGPAQIDDGFTGSRGGAITVHVVDDFGNPTAGAEVRALAVAGEGADRTLTRARPAATHATRLLEKREFYTDDRGDARIYGLPAGDYVVVADPLFGSVVDQERGEHTLTYAPIYFPNSLSRAGAHALSIQPWDEVNLEIALAPNRAAHIAGRVVRWDGEPGRTFVVLSLDPSGPLYPQGLITDSMSRAELVEGEFRFDNLLPGDYIIRTSYDPESDVRDGVAELRVTVEGQDITDLVLTTVRDR